MANGFNPVTQHEYLESKLPGIIETRHLSAREAAKELGLSDRQVHAMRAKYGLSRKKGKETTPETQKLIEQLMGMAHLNHTEAARILGISAEKVCSIRYRYKLPQNMTRQAKHMELRQRILATKNLSLKEVSKLLGISKSYAERLRCELGIQKKAQYSDEIKTRIGATRLLSAKDAAEELGLSESQVHYLRHKLQIKKPKCVKENKETPAKIRKREETQAKIRQREEQHAARYKQLMDTIDLTCKEAGKKLGVSRQRISQLRKEYGCPSPPRPQKEFIEKEPTNPHL